MLAHIRNVFLNLLGLSWHGAKAIVMAEKDALVNSIQKENKEAVKKIGANMKEP